MRLKFCLSALFLASALVGCGDDHSLAPFEPEISNVADNFSVQATGVRNVTTTASYTWPNSGSAASVNHSTTTTAGTASLVIRDASGATVYDKALSPSLNESTASGASGNWTVQLTLTDYSGTINFRVQKL